MLDAKRSSGARMQGGAEPIWWAIAGSLSLAALALPNYLSSRPEPSLRLIITGCALVCTGALVGFFRPERIWRWALASLIAFALRDVLLAASQALNPGLSLVLDQISSNAQVYGLEATLVLVGAGLGSWTTKAGLE